MFSRERSSDILRDKERRKEIESIETEKRVW